MDVLFAIPFGSLMGLYGPAAQALMSRRVSATEQGELQGANASIMGITGMAGPTLFAMTFAKFIDGKGFQLPGAPFFLSAGLVAIAMVVAWRVTSAGAGSPPPAEGHPATA